MRQHQFIAQLLITQIDTKCQQILALFLQRLNQLRDYTRDFTLVEYERLMRRNLQRQWQVRQKLLKEHYVLQSCQHVERFKEIVVNLQSVFPGFGERQSSYPNPILEAPEQPEHGQLEFECEHCGKAFVTQSTVRRHFITKHKFTYPCRKCTVRFRDPIDAWVHQQIIHEPTSQYYTTVCVHCKLTFYDGKGLRKHLMRSHTKQVREEFYHSKMSNTPDHEDDRVVQIQKPPKKVKSGFRLRMADRIKMQMSKVASEQKFGEIHNYKEVYQQFNIKKW